ncbi:MAG: hypothetical protein AVDCRST_MAG54-3850, partial [uncultured Actinomycetospora sp.]
CHPRTPWAMTGPASAETTARLVVTTSAAVRSPGATVARPGPRGGGPGYSSCCSPSRSGAGSGGPRATSWLPPSSVRPIRRWWRHRRRSRVCRAPRRRTPGPRSAHSSRGPWAPCGTSTRAPCRVCSTRCSGSRPGWRPRWRPAAPSPDRP